MEKLIINASRRSVFGKRVGALRRQGLLPGVIYGHNIEATPIQMKSREASRVLDRATGSSLVTIVIEGKESAALVREVQRNYITRGYLHVDFQAVSLTEKIRAKVGIDLTGVSPAVKDFNAFVVENLNEVEVECFPQDLPERITVDISTLTKIGDQILVSDLKVSDKVEILTPGDEVVAVATQAGKDEEVVTEEAAAGEPEVIERGKKDEEGEE